MRRVTWIGLSCLGLLAFVWAVLDPRFRSAIGILTGSVALPISAGIACIIGAWATVKTNSLFGLWLAIGLTGQAVSLLLINAGNLLHYQHYKSLGDILADGNTPLLIFVGAETVLVSVGLWQRRASLRSWFARNLRFWQLLIIAAAFFGFAAAVSRDAVAFSQELVWAGFIEALALGQIVLILWALPVSHAQNIGERVEKALISRWLPLVASIAVLVVSAFLCVFVYQAAPHIPDELIYFFHARYFANGELWVPAPPVPEAFSIYMIPFRSANWYSIFSPGWPTLLALGIKFGVPWLVNPVLAALNVWLAYWLISELYDRRSAGLVALLLALSPWYVFMAMSFMSHIATLFFTLIAAIGIVLARRTRPILWALISGAAIGVVSLMRPLDGAIVGLLVGLWAIGLGGKRLSLSGLMGLGIGVILVGGSVVPYNILLTGKVTPPLDTYYEEYFGHNSNALGFGPDRGLGWALQPLPGHSPLSALINNALNLFSVNVELFGWALGSLLLISLALVTRKRRTADLLMLAVIVLTLGAYSLYWYSGGPDLGARYWFVMIVPLIALSVRGLGILENTLLSAERGRVLVAVLVLCGFALVSYFPWRSIDKYWHYLQMSPDVQALATQYHFGNSLVLVRGNEMPDYASAWALNPLDLRSEGTIYAWDKNPEIRSQLLKAYAGRHVWIVDGPSVTQSGFKVVAGPLSTDQATLMNAP